MLSEIDERLPWLRSALLDPFPDIIGPMHASVGAVLAAIGAAGAFHAGLAPLAGVLVLLNGYLDILDGHLARRQGRTSERGDFVDHSFDRFADAALFIGAAFSPLVMTLLGLITTIAVLLVSYLGTQAQALTDERLYAGLAGRSDRIMLLAIGAMLMPLYAGALQMVVGAVLVLSVVTIVQRTMETWDRLG